MADQPEETTPQENPKTEADRPASAGSKGSAVSKKSIGDAVSKLTVKALKDFRLSDPSDVDTTVTGAESEFIPGANLNIDLPSLGMPEGTVGQTLLSDQGGGISGGVYGDDDDDGEEVYDDGQGGVDDDDISDEESDGESEMVVLDPDHPLMLRFQAAYKAHLIKQEEKVNLELRELSEDLKNKKREREELGVKLYGVQQELARQQMLLEKEHDKYNEEKQQANQSEMALSEVKDMHKKVIDDLNHNRKKARELRTEVENIAARLHYMEEAKEDVRSDISVMRRAAEKADTEVNKAESEKKKQDLLVDRLTLTVDHLREEINMYEAQCIAQLEETKAAKKALSEAITEIEALQLEQKQLLQQWNSSLIGMRRRDEAYAAMQDALNLQRQRIQAIETEIEGYKRSISKAQEQNEQITLMHNKIEADISMVKKQISISRTKQEALKTEYTTYTRTLHQTEQSLNRAQTEVVLKDSELTALRKQIEREFQEKVGLEDTIMEKLRSQLTMDKASQYTKKMTDRMRRRATEMQSSVAEVENEISRDVLEISNTTTRIRLLQEVMDSLNDEIHQKNEDISKIENEIVKCNAIIERKQSTIDQYNKRIDQIRSKDGGEELGPLELQIHTLQKQIEARMNDIIQLQQFWLRSQSELVKTAKDVQQQNSDMKYYKKQYTILQQKKLRIEGEIGSHRNEIASIERNIRSMQNDMTKLNTLITKEHGYKENLEQSNILMETDFIQSLKEAEHESIEMQNQIEALMEEKERLLNSLVEAERQIMLWEKKTQLAREAKHAVDSDYGQGEIHSMKAEIHRMEVRYAQLMRQQEKMIQDMEKAVVRREVIITRGDAQAKMGRVANTKGSFQKKLVDMKKKIKQTNNDANACDAEIQGLRENQVHVSQELEEKQVTCQQLQSRLDELDADVDKMAEDRQRNLADIVAIQQKAKYYNQLKEGRYTALCKTPESLEAEMQKQRDRLQSLMTIVDRLNQEFPHAQPVLRKVTLSLGRRGLPDDA
ncbi:coiled-coil domain-containing protein 40 [Nematostella vectensis]|uniref:coiled-coil domain-containing protein 40 n=1 Tax=Nematostella vectensis TaxID=45351 RepID=UPI00207714AD|nr:coiled-coil domain-containing protein 40 [Nematostella vectensis]